MDNEDVSEEYLRSLFKNVRMHLDDHLTPSQRYDEDAFVTFKCFLDGIHHKFTRLLGTLLSKQEDVYGKDNDEHIDDATIPLLLKLVWLQIHKPTFQWFERWFHDIMRLDSGKKFRMFRKFHSKMVYFFKTTHKYYYSIIERLCGKYDMNSVVPHDIFINLNLIQLIKTPPTNEKKTILHASNPLTFSIVISLQRCIINLGSTHFYKTLLNKPSKKIKGVGDFNKSIRYLKIASLCLPSVGDTYTQLAGIYLRTGNFSLYFFELVRGALVRIPSKHALDSLKDLILTPNSPERMILVEKLRKFGSKSLKGKQLFFENRIVLQFLSILEHTMFPNLLNSSRTPNFWLSRENLQADITKYHPHHINAILENLATVMGSFDLMFTNEKSKELRSRLKYVDLNRRQVSFLNLSFEFIANILDIVIKPSWQKHLENFQYLATMRLLICWIKSYRSILQYAHRHKKFCTSLALLLNDMINSPLNYPMCLSNHRPRRNYYFEEDIMFREFSCVNFALTDFNNDLVYDSPNMINNIIGCPLPTDRLPTKEEFTLRIKSIIFSGVKFLEKNDTGIIWDASKYKFELVGSGIKESHKITLSDISLKINIKAQQERPVSLNKVEHKAERPPYKKTRIITVTELESQFASVRKAKKLSLKERESVLLEPTNQATTPEENDTISLCSGLSSYSNKAVASDGRKRPGTR